MSEGEKSCGASRPFIQFIVCQAHNVPSNKKIFVYRDRAKNGNFRTQFAFARHIAARTYRLKLFENQQYSALVKSAPWTEEKSVLAYKRKDSWSHRHQLHHWSRNCYRSAKRRYGIISSFLFHVRPFTSMLLSCLTTVWKRKTCTVCRPDDPWWAISVSAPANNASFSPETPEHRYRASDDFTHCVL